MMRKQIGILVLGMTVACMGSGSKDENSRIENLVTEKPIKPSLLSRLIPTSITMPAMIRNILWTSPASTTKEVGTETEDRAIAPFGGPIAENEIDVCQLLTDSGLVVAARSVKKCQKLLDEAVCSSSKTVRSCLTKIGQCLNRTKEKMFQDMARIVCTHNNMMDLDACRNRMTDLDNETYSRNVKYITVLFGVYYTSFSTFIDEAVKGWIGNSPLTVLAVGVTQGALFGFMSDLVDKLTASTTAELAKPPSEAVPISASIGDAISYIKEVVKSPEKTGKIRKDWDTLKSMMDDRDQNKRNQARLFVISIGVLISSFSHDPTYRILIGASVYQVLGVLS